MNKQIEYVVNLEDKVDNKVRGRMDQGKNVQKWTVHQGFGFKSGTG